jgi:hypothetical protein
VVPLTWSGSNPPLAMGSVHPGSGRHIDLLHVDWPARDEIDIARKWSEAAPVLLDLTPKPADGREILYSGTYEISVEVRARNADAIRYTAPPTGTASGPARRPCGITFALSRLGRFGDTRRGRGDMLSV